MWIWEKISSNENIQLLKILILKFTLDTFQLLYTYILVVTPVFFERGRQKGTHSTWYDSSTFIPHFNFTNLFVLNMLWLSTRCSVIQIFVLYIGFVKHSFVQVDSTICIHASFNPFFYFFLSVHYFLLGF